MEAGLLLVLSTCLAPMTSRPVDGDGVTVTDVAQLRRAVAEAKAGTTILIAPGTYEGGLTARGRRGERAGLPDHAPGLRGP